MKTIEQAEKEYSEYGFYNHCAPEYIAKMGFRAGVAFAQKWKSCDEELPEIGKIVLLKNDENDFSTGCWIGKYFKIDFDDLSSKTITHWRPIEIE